jgi:hypothetical protein
MSLLQVVELLAQLLEHVRATLIAAQAGISATVGTPAPAGGCCQASHGGQKVPVEGVEGQALGPVFCLGL